MNEKAIFLSYASQDGDAAARICEALRAGGLEVWFDRNELRGGDAWDASIRKQIKECALFVPLVSANTDERSEGYFRLEWKLAVDRSHLIADDRSFLLPIVVDDTPEATARVPDRFRERQWMRLPGGDMPEEFVERVRRLLAETQAPTFAAASVPVGPADVGRKRGWLAAGATVAVIVIVGILGTKLWSDRATRDIPVPIVAPAPAPAPDRKSIAVLPFDNLSGRAEDSYLADGLQEEILNAIAKFRDLKVISRTSVAEFRGKAHNAREIGQRLGVGTILEGSIRRDGNTLRLTVQLIDTHDDHHLLATNYDRELKRVLDLQSTVARLVANALAATLTMRERGELDRVATNSGDAYDLYLRAVASFRTPNSKEYEKLATPKRLLEEALRIDPDNADALAMLSRVNSWMFYFGEQPQDGAAAKQCYERALAQQKDLPEAMLARGLYTMYVAKDPDRALVDLNTVVQARPSNVEAHQLIGFALRRRGHFDEALAHQARAWDLDPLNEELAVNVLVTLTGGLRRLTEGIEATQKYATRFPNNPDPYFVRARIDAYVHKDIEPLRKALSEHGNLYDEIGRKVIAAEIARAEGRYLDAVKLWEDVPVEEPMSRAMRTGFLYLAAGNKDRAERSFRDAERHGLELHKREPARVDLVELGLIQSMLGKHSAAVATIERARMRNPESRDATNGPKVSFMRSVILVRAGRSEEGYGEAARLLHVPFGAPLNFFDEPEAVWLLLKDDPRYDQLLNHPPRL